jgi:excisionase family DNA binding protein
VTTQHQASRRLPIEEDHLAAVETNATEAHPALDDLPEKLTLTVGEAARLLGISRAFAYELVARDELPAIRLGRRILVPTRRLLRLVTDSASRDGP